MCVTSGEINELSTALAKAQGQFTNPHKNRQVKVRTKPKEQGVAWGEYTFNYATFDAILDVVRKPLSDNGLAFVQTLGSDDKGDVLLTRLLHSSGQWLQFPTPIFCADKGAQAFGSGITYAKRYALTALLGIASDEDDDGNAADGNRAAGADRGKKAKPATTNGEAKPDSTRKKTAEYEAAMSPEELEHFVNTRNAFTARINAAKDDEEMKAIATDLAAADERIKGVLRPLWSSRRKILAGAHLPEGERKPEPQEQEQAI